MFCSVEGPLITYIAPSPQSHPMWFWEFSAENCCWIVVWMKQSPQRDPWGKGSVLFVVCEALGMDRGIPIARRQEFSLRPIRGRRSRGRGVCQGAHLTLVVGQLRRAQHVLWASLGVHLNGFPLGVGTGAGDLWLFHAASAPCSHTSSPLSAATTPFLSPSLYSGFLSYSSEASCFSLSPNHISSFI